MKAQKTEEEKIAETIKDLFVKLKKVFPSDVYIILPNILWAGEKSSDISSGDNICILEPKYTEAIFKSINKTEGILYIPSVDNAKLEFINIVEEVTDDEKKISLITSAITHMKEYVSTVDDWQSFKDFLDKDNQINFNTLFDDKDVISLKDEKNNSPAVIIGQSFIPLVTDKNYENLFYSISKTDNGELYTLMFNFVFTHFQLYQRFYFVPSNT